MTPEQEREAFEAWVLQDLLDAPVHTSATDKQWRAWQARASLAQPASVPAPLPAPEYNHCDADYSVGHGVGYVQGWNACIEATLAAAPQAPQPAQADARFDADGFRAWVLANLPDDTVVGNGAWWANHLTGWAGRFVKTAPAPQPEAQPQWQPIETAPKDGRVVLVTLANADVPHSARWHIKDGCWSLAWDGWELSGLDGPTHWMPLPAAPSAQAEPISALVAESERLGLYDVPPLAELREKLGGWGVPEVSGKQAEQGGKQ